MATIALGLKVAGQSLVGKGLRPRPLCGRAPGSSGVRSGEPEAREEPLSLGVLAGLGDPGSSALKSGAAQRARGIVGGSGRGPSWKITLESRNIFARLAKGSQEPCAVGER